MSLAHAVTAVDRVAAGRNAAVGVFDSGIGGLSILRALRAELPVERFVYLADSAHAPYGERTEAFVLERSLAVTRELVDQFKIKALVVACNSATACAIDQIRSSFPALAVIGVEPAVKPALAVSRTRRIGVIGTRATLSSARFRTLLRAVEGDAEFIVRPCDGLATAIEKTIQLGINQTIAGAPEIEAICAHQLSAMGTFGSSNGEIDTLVLGCTHYLFAQRELRLCTGPDVTYIEPGAPVAKQARKLLERQGMLQGNDLVEPISTAAEAQGDSDSALRLVSTANTELLQAAALRWL